MAKQLIATLVTNSNGEAFYNYTGTGSGQTTFIAESGELESNSLIINDINQELTITADKNILSYADNESCTITATYEGPSVDGQTVVFKNGNTILATKTTDSNGIATYDYQSQGVGDVTITVECMNLQETYSIEDCNLYDVGSQTGLSHYSTPIPLQSTTSACQMIYDSTMNAYKITDRSNTIKGIPFDLSNLPSSVKIECDLYVKNSHTDSAIGIFGGTASNGFDYLLTNFTNWLFAKNIFTGSTQSVKLSDTSKIGQWVHLTVENNNGTVTATFSQNNTTIVTDTITTSNIGQYGIAIGWSNGYYAWIKNIKVKPL